MARSTDVRRVQVQRTLRNLSFCYRQAVEAEAPSRVPGLAWVDY